MAMRRSKTSVPCRSHGQALPICLAIILGLLVLVASTQMMVANQLAVSKTERDYDRALMLAEAGSNTYVNMLTNGTPGQGVANSALVPPAFNFDAIPTVQQFKEGVQNGVYTLIRYPANSQQGYFAGQIHTSGASTTVVAFGWSNGIVRRVQVKAQIQSPWAVYTMDHVSLWSGNSITINGDIGTNTLMNFAWHPSVNGKIWFNGGAAGWLVGVIGTGYTVVHQANPVTFLTVSQAARKRWPAATYTPSGLSYVATHNDNGRASPPINNNIITDSVTLTGPGDYYVTRIDMTGHGSLTLDNTNGPVRLWIGPIGGPGTCNLRGGTAVIKANQDKTRACTIYCCSTSGITLIGDEEMDAALYCYNLQFAPNGVVQQFLNITGNPTIISQVLANKVDISGNPTITAVDGLIAPSNLPYQCVPPWEETNESN